MVYSTWSTNMRIPKELWGLLGPREVPGFPLKGSFKGDIGPHRAYFW